MKQYTNEMAQTLDLMKSSIDGPDIEAWPANSDNDTSAGKPSLVGVDTSLGFTVVVIEPPTGLTFLALAKGESHDHCILPHVESQWSALFEQPYDKVARAKGIRLTDGIMRDNSTLEALASQIQSSAAVCPNKANHLWEGPLGHKMVDWCYHNASTNPLASDRLRLWLWEVAGGGITKPIGSVHKGQVYYRCYQHLSEDNGVRYVMGENLIANPAPGPMFSPVASPNAVPVIGAAAPAAIAHGAHYDHQQHLDVLRNNVAPGAISGWVQRYAS